MTAIPNASRVVVITGATGGLGSELVLAFAQAGFLVFGIYHTSSVQAEALSARIPERISMFCADIACPDEVVRAADFLRGIWGRADVVINNAGITRDAPLLRQHEAEWDAVMRVNLSGAFHMLRAFVPLMQPGGHVVNISSYSGLKGKAGQAAYSASKAALLGLTKTAAIELAPAGICVNAVLPGYLPVGMGPRAAQAAQGAIESSLLKRLSDPAEAAIFVLNLSRMQGVTGQIFCLDSRIV